MKEIKLLCAGECMMEMRSQDDNLVSGFAGDIINFCIYLKRLSPESTPAFFSSVGQDPVSKKMLAFLNEEGINTDLVSTRADKTIGLYMIQNDVAGERSFTYWRSDSAARQMFQGTDAASIIQSASKMDYFYFSGITLAILDQAGRDHLITLAQTLHDQGKTIVFDPNLRPSLWSSMEEARIQTIRAFKVCDILLSSYDDDHLLFGDSSTDIIFERLMSFDINEIVLTNGEAEINGAASGERFTVMPARPEAVVDTTAAGDSFNAGYIVARHSGCSARESSEKASSLAALVISHAGAIIPKEIRLPALQENNQQTDGTNLRNYTDPERDSVEQFYRLNHQNQTYEFSRSKRKQYGALNQTRMGIWQACEKLNEIVDDSDPDTDLSQMEHLLQTAEAIRRDGHPDWFILTGLLHDLGKMLCLFGEPQWAVVGDTFPLGCPFSEKIVYPEFFKLNPDIHNETYQQPLGIYTEGCGLENVTMSWGHDEYLYQVCKEYLPIEALYIIRYHSFYSAHQEGEYEYLFDQQDEKMFEWVRKFQPYDLYSKLDEPPDQTALKPYYCGLIDKYFPSSIAF